MCKLSHARGPHKKILLHTCLIMLAGQSSDAKEVQAVCMVTIAKMVQAAKAAQIQAHLAQLVPALLESLSGMEVGCRSNFMRLLHMPQA